ncbi:MAG: GNAT family N-acetyltransferase [Chitinophagales bacterium]|nr:GNAT family N-acetyltransferase [Chitinophagales bacterium]HAE35708.1 GNAT family N-acetyltransferase [Bacteroidota bacterium]HPR30123.1 GNAT family N-acetyltransferase [Chitinophagales bacterium]
MYIREATLSDISAMQIVRRAVRENALSDPTRISDEDYVDFLTSRGKGWVAIENGEVNGFAIADLQEHNIWALFVHPDHEAKGIGLALHDQMLNWYFSQTNTTVWLSTAPGTRAERFYHKAGWTLTGYYGQGELRFEISSKVWKTLHQ